MASVSQAPMAASAAFGVTSTLNDNGVHFLADTTYVTVAGHMVVERTLSDSKAPARFLTGTTTGMCGVSAIAVSPDRRTLAVAEVATPGSWPVINVYAVAKLIKRRSLSSIAAGSHQYVSLCFTCDGKHIAALGGAPEWLLQLWNIVGVKVVGSIRTVTLNSTAAYQVRAPSLPRNLSRIVKKTQT